VARTHPLFAAHLVEYLGTWPPAGTLEVVGSPARLRPAWDGATVLAVAVTSPEGTVISVPPDLAHVVRNQLPSVNAPLSSAALAASVEAPGRASPWVVLRWTDRPAALPPAGEWVESSDPALPDWLRPFPSPVLAVLNGDGEFVAGLGIKKHTRWGQELAVGTEEKARGQGLARRLVAHAGAFVRDNGAIPLYVHHPANEPSARVADAAGFPDLGWRLMVVSAASPPEPG
jgi:GNAT superfamily N-acetyltransferase